MRVLIVTHDAEHGGANNTVLSLLRHPPENLAAEWVFLRPGPVVAQAPVPSRVIDVGRARQLWRVPRAVATLRAAIEGFGADLVFAHVTKAQLYASVAARRAGVASLWWQQERYGQHPLMHQVAGRLPAAAVICSADHTAAEQRARFPRTPVVRIHLGIETEGIGAPREHREARAVRIGILGRLQRWKRVELALRAMPAVLEALPEARLVVMGGASRGLDEDYPEQLRSEAARLGIASAVEFAGHVPDGAGALRQIDVLVHCAEVEPFGLVPLEAMARGVPVVVPDEGGPRETVRHGTDGLRLDPADSAALASAIVELASDPARRQAMGAAGRERVLSLFTARRMAGEAWALAADVAERPR